MPLSWGIFIGDIMKLLNDYFALQKQIYDYFGYVEDWKVIPLEDSTEYYWQLEQDSNGSGVVRFAEDMEKLEDIDAGQYYEHEIYTQRFLPKWVYRTKDYTMISVDTHTDGNKFLAVFDNKKEVQNKGN